MLYLNDKLIDEISLSFHSYVVDIEFMVTNWKQLKKIFLTKCQKFEMMCQWKLNFVQIFLPKYWKNINKFLSTSTTQLSSEQKRKLTMSSLVWKTNIKYWKYLCALNFRNFLLTLLVLVSSKRYQLKITRNIQWCCFHTNFCA